MNRLLNRYSLILAFGVLVTLTVSACTHLSGSLTVESLNEAGGGIAGMPPALSELN